MPTTSQAKKALRQSRARYLKNESVRRHLKKLVKDLRKAVAVKDEKTKALMHDVQKAFDKAVKIGIVKKNTANRTKSRLAALIKQSLALK